MTNNNKKPKPPPLSGDPDLYVRKKGTVRLPLFIVMELVMGTQAAKSTWTGIERSVAIVIGKHLSTETRRGRPSGPSAA